MAIVGMILLLAALSSTWAYVEPSMPRLGYGDGIDEMVLTFTTPNATDAGYLPAVWIAEADEAGDSGFAVRVLAERSLPPSLCGTLGPWVHLVRFKGLRPEGKYIYRFGDARQPCGKAPPGIAGCSKTYEFVAAPTPGDKSPRSFVLVGDMGLLWSSPTIRVLADRSKHFDFVHHNGDISYADNLYWTNPGLYQDWMGAFYNNITPISAKRPWMLGVGNHEAVCNYSEFTRRAAGNPFRASSSTSTQYFARLHGSLFLIVLSAEEGRLDSWQSEEFQWFRSQLQLAQLLKRNGTSSWTLTFVHYPVNPIGYCSYSIDYCCDGQQTGDGRACGRASKRLNSSLFARTEDLILEHEVDIHFTAHEHVYERSEPVYRYRLCSNTTSRYWLQEQQYIDPACPLYVITGSAGDAEVFPNTWMREPEWSHPSRTNMFGFVNVSFEARAEHPYDGHTLHVSYEAVGEILPGKSEAFPADQFALVRTKAGRQSRQRIVQELLKQGQARAQPAADLFV